MTGKLYLRGKTWWARYSHRGREYRFSCETESREKAQAKLDVNIAKLSVNGMLSPRNVRLETLINDLMGEYQATNRGGMAVACERNWRLHLEPFFHRAKVSELGTSDFTEYRNHRLEHGAAHASINHELGFVISAYKLGYRSTPPKVERMPYIKLTKLDNARKTFITDEQRDALFAAASKEGLWARVILEMAYLLGWRRGELLRLKVGDFNIADRTLRIAKTKNGEGREVPLTERLAMLVQQLVAGKNADDKMFPTTSGGFTVVWFRIRAAAGCPKVMFHDFRRTSARAKRAAGVPEGVIMELQGWKTAAMFRRYAIVDNTDKRRALELVDFPLQNPAQSPHNPTLSN